MIAALLLSLTIAYPRAGARLPCVDSCYMIGAVDKGVTNIVVGGQNVPVYRTGAWATLVNVKSGTNIIDVAGSNHVFYVAEPKKTLASTAPAKVRQFKKLPYASDAAQEMPTNKAPSEIVVVIDPGHGGSDSGALSPHALKEKDFNLKLSKEVALALETLGYNVVMTRTNDVSVGLYDRPKIAHDVKADAFISIHYNAPAINRNPRDIRYMAVYAWNDIGVKLAKSVNAKMVKACSPALSSSGVIKANFAVIRNPQIPSCLIEADFMTSPEGEEAASDLSWRKKMARAIAEGFGDWARGN